MQLALAATAVLLVAGIVLILVQEWQGVLAGMGVADKIHNAWFQFVTLRTAGFNTVDIAGGSAPSFRSAGGLPGTDT